MGGSAWQGSGGSWGHRGQRSWKRNVPESASHALFKAQLPSLCPFYRKEGRGKNGRVQRARRWRKRLGWKGHTFLELLYFHSPVPASTPQGALGPVAAVPPPGLARPPSRVSDLTSPPAPVSAPLPARIPPPSEARSAPRAPSSLRAGAREPSFSQEVSLPRSRQVIPTGATVPRVCGGREGRPPSEADTRH